MRLQQRYPSSREGLYAVVGDFNATKKNTVMQTFFKNQMTEAIRAYDSRGEVWTYYYAREDVYERVDFLLVSQGLKPHVLKDSAKIVDIPKVMQGSDHRMLYLDLLF